MKINAKWKKLCRMSVIFENNKVNMQIVAIIFVSLHSGTVKNLE